MSLITKETVKKIAELSRLKLSEQEIEQYQKELEEFFEHAKALEEVNTDWIEPLYQVWWLKNITREDKIQKSEISEKLVSCSANKSTNWSFLVKNVL